MPRSEISIRKNMLAKDMFEVDKVQVFDLLTGNWICTMTMYDSTNDKRLISEYNIQAEVKAETDKNQLQLF